MAIDPQAVVKFLKESRVHLFEEEEDDKGGSEDKGVKEGDKVEVEIDGEKVTGEVIEVHDGNARVKSGEDIHTAKVDDLKKV